jgi:hypothetical protein
MQLEQGANFFSGGADNLRLVLDCGCRCIADLDVGCCIRPCDALDNRDLLWRSCNIDSDHDSVPKILPSRANQSH